MPLPLKLQIRGLYLVQQLGSTEIAAKLKITPRSVENLCQREGWTKLRKGVSQRAQAKALEREKIEIEEVVDAVAIQTAALTVQTLEKASRAIHREDEDACRDLQALSQSAKNFNGIFRQARGLDIDSRERNANGSTLVFIDLPRVEAKKEINVTPTPALPAEIIPPKLAE